MIRAHTVTPRALSCGVNDWNLNQRYKLAIHFGVELPAQYFMTQNLNRIDSFSKSNKQH